MNRLGWLLIVLCAGCVSGERVSKTSDTRDVLSAIDFFYHGRAEATATRLIKGYLTFGDDKHNIWQSRSDYQYIRDRMPDITDPRWNKCITLFSYGKFRDELLKFDGKTVIITGTLIREKREVGSINTGSCSDIGISIDSVRLSPSK